MDFLLNTLHQQEEIDDMVVEGVQVSFYTRPISLSSCVEILSDAEINCTKDREYQRHWAVSFFFPNSEQWITYEANRIDRKLVWTCTNSPPIKVEGCKLYENIATCKTSPKQLQEWAKKIKINNLPYNVAFRNCQEWIKLFVQQVDDDVWNYINTNFKTFFNNYPFAAVIVGTMHSLVNAKLASQRNIDEEVPLAKDSPLFKLEDFKDRKVLNVEVTLYTHPVSISASCDMNTSEELVARVPGSVECDRNWTLAFYFSGSDWHITYEAVLKEKKLTWVSTQMPSPIEVRGGTCYKNIATCSVSPNQLRRWANEIENNTNKLHYNNAYKNTQLWIKRLAHKIDGDVWHYFQNLREYPELSPDFNFRLVEF